MTLTRKRLVVVLVLCVAAAFGARALRSDHHQRLAEHQVQRDAARLFDCQKSAGPPVGIVITSKHGTLALKQSPHTDNARSTRWRVTDPLMAEADDDLVDAFVDIACSAESMGTIAAKPSEPAIDLSLFSLNPPNYLVTLAWDDQRQSTVAVGDVSGFNNRLYVRRSKDPQDGCPVEHTDGALTHPLQRDVHAWRQKRPFVGVQAHEVVQAESHVVRGPSLVLTHDGNGNYAVAHGQSPNSFLAADPLKAREWLGAVLDAHAEQFVADAPDDGALKRFALTSPAATIELTLRDGSRRTLRLGRLKLAETIHLFVQADGAKSPILRLTQNSLWDKLTAGPQGLEDMRVLHVQMGDVAHVTVSQQSRTVHYRLDNNTWQLLLADGSVADAQLDSSKLNAAISHLLQMRAARIVTRHAVPQELKQGGLIVPKHTIAFATASERPLAILWVGRHDAGQTLVTDDQKQTLWSVFEGTAETFTADPQPFLIEPVKAQ